MARRLRLAGTLPTGTATVWVLLVHQYQLQNGTTLHASSDAPLVAIMPAAHVDLFAQLDRDLGPGPILAAWPADQGRVLARMRAILGRDSE